MKPKFSFGWDRLTYNHKNKLMVYTVGSKEPVIGFVFYYSVHNNIMNTMTVRSFEIYQFNHDKLRRILSNDVYDCFLHKKSTFHQMIFDEYRGSYQFLLLR